MIEMKHVYKIYNNTLSALIDINLKIDKSEFVFLVGPTGAGKTTLFKLIYVEELPTQGQVIVDNYLTTNIKRNQLPYLRRKIGVIFQDLKLLNDRTIYENVALALHVTGTSATEVKRKTMHVLAAVGLSHKYRIKPNRLSIGEQQKVAIARALSNNPKIILADEPTGNLDHNSSEEVFQLLQEFNTRGTTVIFATYDHKIIEKFGYRRIFINHGKIVDTYAAQNQNVL